MYGKVVIGYIAKAGLNGWEAVTVFNIREENNIHESILFVFQWGSDDAIVINYCILYAKHLFIYLEKLKDENKKFNVDFLGYLCHLKYILKIEKKKKLYY